MHATAGQAVVQTLERFGVDRVFGIPGVHTLDIYNALYGFSIEHITRVHEGSIMRTATAMACVPRVPAVAIVSAGLGAINSMEGSVKPGHSVFRSYPTYAEFAESPGGTGFCADTDDDLTEVIYEALNSSGSCIVSVPIAPDIRLDGEWLRHSWALTSCIERAAE